MLSRVPGLSVVGGEGQGLISALHQVAGRD